MAQRQTSQQSPRQRGQLQQQQQQQQHSPRFKSEVFVPIRKDSKSFEERQKSIWEDMQVRVY